MIAAKPAAAVAQVAQAATNKAIAEKVSPATKAAGGHDQVKLDGAAIGGPVLDAHGNVIGVLQPDGAWTSIGSAFRALNLGTTLSDE